MYFQSKNHNLQVHYEIERMIYKKFYTPLYIIILIVDFIDIKSFDIELMIQQNSIIKNCLQYPNGKVDS